MTTQTDLHLFPVSIESLDAKALEVDLYLKVQGEREPVLYRAVGVEFSDEDRLRLIEQGTEFVYIPSEQHRIYREMLTGRLDRIFGDPEINRAERARLVRATCSRMIDDVLLFPEQPTAIETVKDVSRHFAQWSANDAGEFSYLLDMSGHDFYTTTHMINVGVGCGLLCGALAPGDEELQSLMIQAGMLHDIGKRGIPEEILNKEGNLDEREWEIVRKHPLEGVKLLQEHSDIPEQIIEACRDHHERLDGKGYPNGVGDKEIGFAARLCAVVDTYDAISARRPYRGPTPPADTLALMAEGAETKYDPEHLRAWAKLVQQFVKEDPDRAPRGMSSNAAAAAAGEFAPSTTVSTNAAGLGDPAGWSPDERRRFKRHACRLPLKARIVAAGKNYGLPTDKWIDLKMEDISQGGMLVRTPWPLSLNDVLQVEMRNKDGTPIKRFIQIVRIRQARNGDWLAGSRFCSPMNEGRKKALRQHINGGGAG